MTAGAPPCLRELRPDDVPELLRLEKEAYLPELYEPPGVFVDKMRRFPEGALGSFQGGFLLGGVAGMLTATVLPPLIIPPEFPIRADARAWIFAGAAVLFLATAVGLPPAWHAMRLKIVDALAGR